MNRKHSRHAWAAFVIIGVALAGCAPTGSTTATPSSMLTLSPPSLTFSNIGQSQNVVVSDPNYTGTFTTSGCGGIVSAAMAGTTETDTSLASGTCTLTVSDTAGNKGMASVTVTVTTASIPVQ